MKLYTTRLMIESMHVDTSTIGEDDVSPLKHLSLDLRDVDRVRALQAVDAFFDEFEKMREAGNDPH